jgi:hypothetical protein
MDTNPEADTPPETLVPAGNDTTTRLPRRKAPFIAAALVVIVLVTTIVIVNVSSNSSAGAAAAVRKALVSSVDMKSAAFDLSENVSSGTTTITVTGNGACTFVSVDCQMSMNFGGALAADGAVTAVFANSVMYMKFNGAIANSLPTPWVSLPLNISKIRASSGLGSSSSPLALLSLLAQKGAVVTNDGAVTVDGNSLTQYTVTASSAVGQNLASGTFKDLPTWMTTQAHGASAGPFTMTVDVNGSGELASLQMTTTASASGTMTTVSVTETMSDYGVPVDVSIPPANQVTSLASVESSLGTS